MAVSMQAYIRVCQVMNLKRENRYIPKAYTAWEDATFRRSTHVEEKRRTSCHALRFASSQGGHDDTISLMRASSKSAMTGITLDDRWIQISANEVDGQDPQVGCQASLGGHSL